jgi:hypothetical protein
MGKSEIKEAKLLPCTPILKSSSFRKENKFKKDQGNSENEHKIGIKNNAPFYPLL